MQELATRHCEFVRQVLSCKRNDPEVLLIVLPNRISQKTETTFFCRLSIFIFSDALSDWDVDKWISLIGSGSSGIVWRALDLRSGAEVAVKHLRRCADSDEPEHLSHAIRVFRLLSSRPDWQFCFFTALLNEGSCYTDNFLVFELAGISLQYFICDPDSPRLTPALDWRIKLVDLDDAVYGSTCRRYCIGTDSYRSPEACVGLPWAEPTDMFSIGCVAVELFTQRRLFQRSVGHLERLACMERVIGPFPAAFIFAERWARGVFTDSKHPKVAFSESSYGSDSLMRVVNSVPLHEVVRGVGCLSLCLSLLSLDPARRATPRQALRSYCLASVTSGGSGDTRAVNGIPSPQRESAGCGTSS
ncbi:kinase-like domain-containing protein [Mycena vitilis]|nr:kinase-like domain-containing protein [Mycena vitilis]